MKRALIFILTACTLLFTGSAVFATSLHPIRQAMSEGDYETAFSQAEALETADGYALAAESLLSEIMLGRAKKNKKQAKRARKLAEAGLGLNPANQNARLQYAIADGFVARETGDVSAWMKKLPQKTQAIVQAYRDDFPNDPRGDALLGAWHLAIARKAGDKNAQKWFGANIAEGRELFQSARTAQSNDIIIGVNYAFSLLALEEEDLGDVEEARQIITDLIVVEPSDHIGRTLQSYAVLALTKIDDRETVSDYVEMFLDGKVPDMSPEN